MIIQACINGARPVDFHPALPLDAHSMALDAMACVEAGAAELHVHPRDNARRESLAAVNDTVFAIREACLGTLIGVSTGEWIEDNAKATREAISAWRVLPDYASVNLSEPDAPAVMDILRPKGVGIEAGIATADDARRLVSLPNCDRIFRVLIEIDAESFEAGTEVVEAASAALANAGLRKPVLLHGFDNTVWPFVKMAFARRWSTRVGLEDGKTLPNGDEAPNNAAIVAAAMAMRQRPGF